MLLNGRFRLLGTEEGKTKDGKPYYVLGLAQGIDSERLYIDEKMYKDCQAIPKFSEIDCEVNIQIRQDRTYLNCKSVQQVQPAETKPAETKAGNK